MLWQATESELTQSAEASHARTSARREKVRELKANAPAYGANMPDLLANYDPASCSWRTSQHCLVEGLTVFSETWPRSGMMRNGIAYQLPPLVRLTDATGSGLWPTPTVPNGGRSIAHVDTFNGRTAYHKGKKVQVDLNQMVRLWPTPRANDAEKRGRIANDPRNGLPAAVMYPTPCASDHRDRGGPSNPSVQRRASIGKSIELSMTVDGQLNPTWVEWLMGFPTGHTALKPSETP